MTASQAFAVVSTELTLDAGGGISATIDVSDLGIVTCTGTCGGLVIPGFITPHTTVNITGTLGQFTIDATGKGGNSNTGTTLQNFNQIEASSSGAGELFTEFTDTDYCEAGGGHCFGSQFILSASTVIDDDISTSTADFEAFNDGSDAVPAGNPIGGFTGLTGDSDAKAGHFVNPGGASGSLTSAVDLVFAGEGDIQANFTVATTSVPEPASFMLLGTFMGLVGLVLRRKTHKV
jgi:hypothetical protein